MEEEEAEDGVDSPYLNMEEESPMMMSDEDCYRSMAEEDDDPSYEENLPRFGSETTTALGELERQMQSPPDERDHLLAFSQLDWSESLEDSTVDLIRIMTGHGDCCRQGAAHFAAKEPALAETLRGKAAWYDATRAGLEEVVAAGARRVRVACLRMLAEAEESDVVHLAAEEYLAHVIRDTPQSGDSVPVFPTEAAADQVHAAAVEGARDPAVKRLVEGFAVRAGRLRRSAAEFEGEDLVLALGLMELAAMVEAMCADAETFVHKVVSSSYWRFWRAFSRGR